MSWVVAIAGPFGYSTLFLGLALEYLGLPVPGEGILLVGGLLAGQGYLRLGLALPLILLGVLAADTLWFWLGRRRGPSVVRAACRLTRNSSGCIGRVERTYERLGLASILCGKFLPGIRQLIPALAGTFRVPYPLFLLLDVLGTTTWVLVFWTLGRILGGFSPWDGLPVVGSPWSACCLCGASCRGACCGSVRSPQAGAARICRFGKKNCRNGIAESAGHPVLAKRSDRALGREGAAGSEPRVAHPPGLFSAN